MIRNADRIEVREKPILSIEESILSVLEEEDEKDPMKTVDNEEALKIQNQQT